MSIVGWAIQKYVENKEAEMFEAFATPEFKEAIEQLGLRGLLTALPQMQLDLDTQLVKFPEPDTTVPVVKGLLNGLETSIKKKFNIT
jgi:hypothetical protein